MLVKAYGQFWNPYAVNWGAVGRGNKGELIGVGKIKGTNCEIDFWDACGIYVLYNQFAPVYIGKADSVVLGSRLRSHLSDRHAGRWDMFSWFCTSTVNSTYGDVRKPGKRHVTPSTVVQTLEAIAILISDAPLNRRRESIDGAIEFEQVSMPSPKAVREYLEEILKKLE